MIFRYSQSQKEFPEKHSYLSTLIINSQLMFIDLADVWFPLCCIAMISFFVSGSPAPVHKCRSKAGGKHIRSLPSFFWRLFVSWDTCIDAVSRGEKHILVFPSFVWSDVKFDLSINQSIKRKNLPSFRSASVLFAISSDIGKCSLQVTSCHPLMVTYPDLSQLSGYVLVTVTRYDLGRRLTSFIP